ncbi:uncharacterized protein LOC106476592 [Limulus polyphemus]|uniref:Uncharacterized protein LOC106476592 n=1 Tax=Limulus polyphemus TaxID=6850 RepID=A0ABM1C1P8_LIMPO|nr:uncharacterized protein LOC106476592 [Limulus polyphemus]
MRHLAKIASWGSQTGMTPKNVAIVWAPNLLRSKEMEGGGGACALHVVGVQAVLTEYLIRYVEIIFSGKRPSFQEQPEEAPRRPRRPKSLAISSPTKLLSLEEARTRVLAANILGTEQKYIDVGGGPEKLPVKYHTVIELPSSKRSGTKLKKSPSGWKSFFSRGWQSGSTREKDCGRRGSLKLRKGSTGSLQHAQFPLQEKVITEADLIHTRRIKLRTVKSAESLVSCDTSCRSSSAFESTGPTEGSQNNEAGQSSLLEEDFSSHSQSLNNHVRSSSHESYFDLSSKEESPPGDTAMDDKSSVQASLQTVKKSPESDDSFASFEHIFESFMDSDTIASFDGSWTNFSQDDTKHLSSDSNKMTRKQKLRSSDSDVSSPKVQKLSLRHFRQAFSSPSFSSPNETHKRSEWTLFVKEKDRDALRGSFHRTREKIVHVLTPDSVQKKLFSLLEDKQASLKNDKSRSDIMLHPFPPVHLESDTENLPSRKVKSSSDLRISALSCCSDTLSTHYCGDILPQELITAEKSDMHIFDLCFHDNDSETEDDCVKVVDEMLQAVAKKIEEETCGAKLIIEDGVPEENCGAKLIIEDGVPEENCGAKLIIEDGVPEENCGAELIIEDGVPEENCGAKLIIEDGVPEENCGAKLIIEDGVPEENCGAKLIIEDGVPEENCGAELIIEDGVPEENCGAELIIEDGVPEENCGAKLIIEDGVPEENCGAELIIEDCVPVEEQLNCVPSSAGQSGKILWTEDENQKSTKSLTTTRDESYNCSGMQIYSINEVCSFDSELEELNSSISHCDEDSKALVEETTNTQKSFNQSDIMTSAKDDVFCAIKQELNILPQHIPFSKQQDTSREFPESRLPEQRTSLSRTTESFLIPQLEDMESETLDEEGGNELNDLSKKYKGFRIEDDFSQGSPDVFVDVICDPVPSEQKRSNEKLRKSLIIQNGRLYRTIEKDGDSDKSLKVHSLPDSQNGKDAASVAPLNYPKFQRVCDALNRKSFLDITEQNSKKDVPLDYNRSSPTCKSSQPSLFTQLKVLKLQAFQSPEMSKESIPYDPWSDPILDSVVDPQDIWEKQIFSSSSTPSPSQDDIGEQPLDISKVNINTTRDHRDQELSLQLRMDASTSKEEEETLERFPKTSTPMLLPAEYLLSSPIQSVKSPNMTSVKSLISFDENDRRERIDRYKEERRAQLRERWKSESFKKETPDKKHVGTRWRSSVPLSRTVASLKDQESIKDKKEQSHSSGNLSDPSLGQDMKEGSDDGRKHSHMERLACRSKGRTGIEEQNTSSWLTQLPDEEKSNHGSDIVPKLSSKVKSDCGLDISTEENTLYQSYVPNQTLVHKHKDYCSLRPETSV